LCVHISSSAFCSTTTQIYVFSWDQKWSFTQI
jgi:hypothetical protein